MSSKSVNDNGCPRIPKPKGMSPKVTHFNGFQSHQHWGWALQPGRNDPRGIFTQCVLNFQVFTAVSNFIQRFIFLHSNAGIPAQSQPLYEWILIIDAGPSVVQEAVESTVAGMFNHSTFTLSIVVNPCIQSRCLPINNSSTCPTCNHCNSQHTITCLCPNRQGVANIQHI